MNRQIRNALTLASLITAGGLLTASSASANHVPAASCPPPRPAPAMRAAVRAAARARVNVRIPASTTVPARVRAVPVRRAEPAPPPPPPTNWGLRRRMRNDVAALVDPLDLTREQASRMRRVLVSKKLAIRRVRASQMSDEAKTTAIARIRYSTNRRLRNILSVDQYRQLRQIQSAS